MHMPTNGMDIQGNITQLYRRNCQYMQQYRCTSKICWMKEARPPHPPKPTCVILLIWNTKWGELCWWWWKPDQWSHMGSRKWVGRGRGTLNTTAVLCALMPIHEDWLDNTLKIWVFHCVSIKPQLKRKFIGGRLVQRYELPDQILSTRDK